VEGQFPTRCSRVPTFARLRCCAFARARARPPEIRHPFPKNIIVLKFKDGTSRELMQNAVDSVCGVVVGGLQPLTVYYIRVPSDRTGKPLFAAIQKLTRMSQVLGAAPSMLSVADE
jgi:hypothetical protein